MGLAPVHSSELKVGGFSVNKSSCNRKLLPPLGNESAADVEPARGSTLSHLSSCLLTRPTLARAEMLKPTNGRTSQAPSASTHWGPHGSIALTAPRPQGDCWVQIQPVPIVETRPPPPHIVSHELRVGETCAPSPHIECPRFSRLGHRWISCQRFAEPCASRERFSSPAWPRSTSEP